MNPFRSKYVQLLEKDLERALADAEFFRGKCERLELALMSYANSPSQDYVSRTEKAASPIESTTVELPKKETWREKIDKWSKMSPEEQDAAVGVEASQPKPEVMQ